MKRLPRLREGPSRYYTDFLAPDAVYNERYFREFHRIPRKLYDRIEQDLAPRLTKGTDATGIPSVPAYVKLLGTLRWLGDGPSARQQDDQWRAAPSTISKHREEVVRAIVDQYGERYLAPPSDEKLRDIMQQYEARGFPGCIGAMDCMQFRWRMAPTLWQGALKGK